MWAVQRTEMRVVQESIVLRVRCAQQACRGMWIWAQYSVQAVRVHASNRMPCMRTWRDTAMEGEPEEKMAAQLPGTLRYSL